MKRKRSNSEKDKRQRKIKIFNDPVHGSIELSYLLVKIIDTPQFQRLRRIKQLGATYYVFPGASHSRFEHSIGTCYLAGKLLTLLQQQQPDLDITDEEKLCIQIAALCHDLGHGPFSHLFEDAMRDILPCREWTHEKASIKMFDYMIEKNNLKPIFQQYKLYKKDIKFIKELIVGPSEETKKRHVDQDFRSKQFLYEIVSNKRTGIDVDKFDYFVRDCHQLGLFYSFNYERFMKFYRVLQVDKDERQLCMRDKEVRSCYELYRTRAEIHHAVQHPVVKGVELLLISVLAHADKSLTFSNLKGEKVPLSKCVDDMDVFMQLDDEILTLIKHAPEDPNIEPAKRILEKIERRELYNYIGCTQPKEESPLKWEKQDYADACKEIFNKCQFLTEIPNDILKMHMVDFVWGNQGHDPIHNLWCYTKEFPDKPIRVSREQISPFISDKFYSQEIRLYCDNRNEEICERVRRSFKQWCTEKHFTLPRGSEHW